MLISEIHPGNYFASQKEEEAFWSCIQEVEKEEKEIQIKSTASIWSPAVSDDNHGADLEEPTSLPKSGTTSKSFSFIDSLFQAPFDYDAPSSSALVSPARVQSVLESPTHHVSLEYESLEDDNQDDDKQSQP